MTTFEWSSKYKIGINEIDSQHEMFVKIINKLVDTQKNNGDKHYIEALLAELLKYAEFHFCSEENIMLEHGYPDFVKHKQQHENVLTELRNRIFSMKYEYIDFANLESFLREWFLSHTISIDVKLAKFLQEKEKSPSE